MVGFLGQSEIVKDAILGIIFIDDISLSCKIYVIDRSLGDCYCIIGRNFTEDLRINYSRIGNTLTFYYENQTVSLIKM